MSDELQRLIEEAERINQTQGLQPLSSAETDTFRGDAPAPAPVSGTALPVEDLDFYEKGPGNTFDDLIRYHDIETRLKETTPRHEPAKEEPVKEEAIDPSAMSEDDLRSALGFDKPSLRGKKKTLFQHSALQYTAETGKYIDINSPSATLQALWGTLTEKHTARENMIVGRIAAGDTLAAVSANMTRHVNFGDLDIDAQDEWLKKAPILKQKAEDFDAMVNRGEIGFSSNYDHAKSRSEYLRQAAREIMGKRQAQREKAQYELEDTPWSVSRTVAVGIPTVRYGNEFMLGSVLGGPVGKFALPFALGSYQKYAEVSTPVFDKEGNVVKAADDYATAMTKGLTHGAYETSTEIVTGEVVGFVAKQLGITELTNHIKGQIKNAIVKNASDSAVGSVGRGVRGVQKLLIPMHKLAKHQAFGGMLPELFEEFIQQPVESAFAIRESEKEDPAFRRLWDAAKEFDIIDVAEGFALNQLISSLAGIPGAAKHNKIMGTSRQYLKRMGMEATAVDLMSDEQVRGVFDQRFTGEMGSNLATALEGAGGEITAQVNTLLHTLDTAGATEGRESTMPDLASPESGMAEGRAVSGDGSVIVTDLERQREADDAKVEAYEYPQHSKVGADMDASAFLDLAIEGKRIKEQREVERALKEERAKTLAKAQGGDVGYVVNESKKGYRVEHTGGLFPAVYAPTLEMAQRAADKMSKMAQASVEIMEKRAQIVSSLANVTLKEGTDLHIVAGDADAQRTMNMLPGFQKGEGGRGGTIRWQKGAPGVTSPDGKTVIINLGAITSPADALAVMKHEGFHTLDIGWTMDDLEAFLKAADIDATAKELVEDRRARYEAAGISLSESKLIGEVLAQMNEALVSPVQVSSFEDVVGAMLTKKRNADGTPLTPRQKRAMQASLLGAHDRNVTITEQWKQAWEVPQQDKQEGAESEAPAGVEGELPDETPDETPDEGAQAIKAEDINSIHDLTPAMVQRLREKHSADEIKAMTAEELRAALGVETPAAETPKEAEADAAIETPEKKADGERPKERRAHESSVKFLEEEGVKIPDEIKSGDKYIITDVTMEGNGLISVRIEDQTDTGGEPKTILTQRGETLSTSGNFDFSDERLNGVKSLDDFNLHEKHAIFTIFEERDVNKWDTGTLIENIRIARDNAVFEMNGFDVNPNAPSEAGIDAKASADAQEAPGAEPIQAPAPSAEKPAGEAVAAPPTPGALDYANLTEAERNALADSGMAADAYNALGEGRAAALIEALDTFAPDSAELIKAAKERLGLSDKQVADALAAQPSKEKPKEKPKAKKAGKKEAAKEPAQAGAEPAAEKQEKPAKRDEKGKGKGNHLARRSIKAFTEAKPGNWALEMWLRNKALFASPGKNAGGEYNPYRAAPRNIRNMLVKKSAGLSPIDIVAQHAVRSGFINEIDLQGRHVEQILVDEFVRQYAAYKQWSEQVAQGIDEVDLEAEYHEAKSEMALKDKGPASVEDFTMEKGDLAKIGGEWYMVKRQTDKGALIEDGHKRLVDSRLDVEAYVRVGEVAYMAAAKEYDEQENRITAERRAQFNEEQAAMAKAGVPSELGMEEYEEAYADEYRADGEEGEGFELENQSEADVQADKDRLEAQKKRRETKEEIERLIAEPIKGTMGDTTPVLPGIGVEDDVGLFNYRPETPKEAPKETPKEAPKAEVEQEPFRKQRSIVLDSVGDGRVVARKFADRQTQARGRKITYRAKKVVHGDNAWTELKAGDYVFVQDGLRLFIPDEITSEEWNLAMGFDSDMFNALKQKTPERGPRKTDDLDFIEYFTRAEDGSARIEAPEGYVYNGSLYRFVNSLVHFGLKDKFAQRLLEHLLEHSPDALRKAVVTISGRGGSSSYTSLSIAQTDGGPIGSTKLDGIRLQHADEAVMVHELIHAATMTAVRIPDILSDDGKAALARIQSMFDKNIDLIQQRVDEAVSGKTHQEISSLGLPSEGRSVKDVEEVVALTLSSKKFREIIDGIHYDSKTTLLDKILDFIMSLFGDEQSFKTVDTKALTKDALLVFIEGSANVNYTRTMVSGKHTTIGEKKASEKASADFVAKAREETGGTDASFKLSGEIEETKDLVALHNLSEGNLRFVLGMGGDLVFPSIAITKKGVPFEGFGDISIIFPKSTIDPRASRANRIYGSDAYTVRFPTVNYDIDKGVMRNINQRLYDALGKKAPLFDEMRFNSEFRGSAGDAKSAFYNQRYIKDTYKHEREKKLTNLKYAEWFDDFFNGIIKGTGIRNEADLIAPSGVRRSFSATHVPVTTANVLRAMKKDAGAGGEGYNYGFPVFIAKMSKKIGTIRHLKEESRRLKKVDDNEMRDIERGLEKTYDGIIQDVYSRGEERGSYFTESDLISDWLANSYAHSPETTRERANKARGGRYQMTLENAKDLHSLVKDIRELPRSYFEAKPQRAVPLSEGLAFIVPKGTPKTLTDAIREQGGKVYRYDGAENRVEVVNKAAQEQNASFKLAGDSVEYDMIEGANAEGGYYATPHPKHIKDEHLSEYAPVRYKSANGKVNVISTFIPNGKPVVLTPMEARHLRKASDAISARVQKSDTDIDTGLPIAEESLPYVDTVRGIEYFRASGVPMYNVLILDEVGKVVPKLAQRLAEEAFYKPLEQRQSSLDMAVEHFDADEGIASYLSGTVGVETKGAVTLGEYEPMALPDFDKLVEETDRKEKDKYRAPVMQYAQDTFGDKVAPNGRKVWQNFVRWFGNSKVVDADGKPLVVYHGTADSSGYTAFKTPSFFTDDYMNADGYANGERIIDAFIKLENPYVFDAKGAKWNDLKSDMGNTTREVVSHIQSLGQGHDGVIFENINDNWADTEEPGEDRIFAVFNPDQIKSATGNVGDYSADKDIMFKLAHHGTPHTFEPEPGFPHGRFRLDKVGSGEGAQAYGHGVYFADQKDVGRGYQKRLTANTAKNWNRAFEAAKLESKLHPDHARKVATDIDDWVGIGRKPKTFLTHHTVPEGYESAYKAAVDAYGEVNRGALYQVDIPDDIIPKLLDWDKPLGEQPPEVKKALAALAEIKKDQERVHPRWELSVGGKDIGAYASEEAAVAALENTKLLELFNKQLSTAVDRFTLSEFFLTHHIPGARYLDADSRNKGGGTHNYVIWDQGALDRISLLKRNEAALDGLREDASFMLAGEKANTAPSLVEAEEMEKAKAGKINIWRKTGWWRGYDGKWRFEIDPSEIKWRNKGDSISILSNRKNATIGDVIEFGKLFAAYPEIKDYSVELRSPYDKRTSTMDFKPATKEFSVKSGINANSFRSAFVHELQHAIQDIEGVTSGINMVNAEHMLHDLRREAVAGTGSKTFNDVALHDEESKAWLDEQNEAMASDLTTDQLLERLTELETRVPRAIKAARQTIEKQAYLDKIQPYDIYRLAGGEAESRLVQYRLNMTDTERKNTPPWVSMEKMLKEEGLLKEGQKVEDVLLGLDRRAKDLARTFETDPTMRSADGFVQSFTQDASFKLAAEDRVAPLTPEQQAEVKRQYDAVVKLYKGTDKWMIAPNGEQTNLNERQWVQVRTDLFKEWFGDWENDPENASKVVDANGEPLVVYHGTGADFDTFDLSYQYTGEGGSHSGSGFYFTTIKESGENYVKLNRLTKEKGRLIEAFLNIRTPVEFDFNKGEVFGAQIKLSKKQIRDIILMAPNIRGEDSPLNNYNDVEYYGFDKVLKEAVDLQSGSNLVSIRNDFFPDHQSWLRALSHVTQRDGAFSNVHGGMHWIAWSPNQIKSATDNTGLFSTGNDNIMFKLSEDTDQMDKAYMGAVENGDMETAQRMVDEAARRAGYDIELWHGTNAEFREFMYSEDIGFHFGTKSQATKIALKKGNVSGTVEGFDVGVSDSDLSATQPRVHKFWGKIKNPVLANDTIWYHYMAAARALENAGAVTKAETNAIFTKAKKQYRGEEYMLGQLQKLLIKKGFDGVAYNNEFEGPGKSYMVFNSSQVKRADIVTYDTDGNIIPLSKRFDEGTDDVMFKLPDDDLRRLEIILKEHEAYRTSPTEVITWGKDGKPRRGEAGALGVTMGYRESVERARADAGMPPYEPGKRHQPEILDEMRDKALVTSLDAGESEAVRVARRVIDADPGHRDAGLSDEEFALLVANHAQALRKADFIIKGKGGLESLSKSAADMDAKLLLLAHDMMLVEEALLKAGSYAGRALAMRKMGVNRYLRAAYRIDLRERELNRKLEPSERDALLAEIAAWQAKYEAIQDRLNALDAGHNEAERLAKERDEAAKRREKQEAAEGKKRADVAGIVRDAWRDALNEYEVNSEEDFDELAALVAERTNATLEQAYSVIAEFLDPNVSFRLVKRTGAEKNTPTQVMALARKYAQYARGKAQGEAVRGAEEHRGKQKEAAEEYEKTGGVGMTPEGEVLLPSGKTLDLGGMADAEFKKLAKARTARAAARQALFIATMEDVHASMDTIVDKAMEVLANTKFGDMSREEMMDIAIDYSMERPADTRDDIDVRYSQLLSEILLTLREITLAEGAIPKQRGRHTTPTTAEYRKKLRNIRNLLKDPRIQAAMRDDLLATANKRAQTTLRNMIEELQIAIRDRTLLQRGEAKGFEKDETTLALESLKEELREQYERLEVVRKDADAKKLRMAEKRLQEWQNKLALAERGVFPEGEKREKNAVTAEIDAQIDAVKTEIKELKRTDPRVVARELERIMDATDRTLAEVERRVAEEEARDTKPYKTDAERKAALEGEDEIQKARRESRRRLREAMRREALAWEEQNPVEEVLKRKEREMDSLTRRKIALEDKIAKKDYQKPAQKRAVFDADLYNARKQVLELQATAHEEMRAAELNAKGWTGKVRLYGGHVNDIQRAVMASLDISFMGIQGVIAARNDILFNKGRGLAHAWNEAIKATMSAEYVDKVMHDLLNDPRFSVAIEHGVDVGALASEIYGGRYASMFMERLTKHGVMPVRVSAQAIAASERHYIVMGAVMRVEMFNRLLDVAGEAGLNDAEMDQLANIVNVYTGTADKNALLGVPRIMGKVLWAARLFASRIARITGGTGLLYHSGTGKGGILLNWSGHSPAMRKVILRAHAEDIISLAVFSSILKMILGLFWRQEHEDEDALWRKIMLWIFAPARVGNQRIDLTGRAWNRFTSFERMLGFNEFGYSGKDSIPVDFGRDIWRILRGSLSPMAGTLLDLGGKDFLGEPYGPLGGYKGIHKPFDWDKSLKGTLRIPGSLTPLSLQDAADAIKEVADDQYSLKSILGTIFVLPFIFAGAAGDGAPRPKDYSWNRHNGIMSEIRKAEKEGDKGRARKLREKHIWNVRNDGRMKSLRDRAKKAEKAGDQALADTYYADMEALWDTRNE